MRQFKKTDVADIARTKSISLNQDWSGPGAVWPLIEEMMMSGCVVVLKLDGARSVEAGDNGNFTVIASGGPLGDKTIRGDFEDLDESLTYLIGNYFEIAGMD